MLWLVTAGHVSVRSLFIASWCLSGLEYFGLLPGPQLPACFETRKSLFNQFSSVPSILATSAAEEALWQLLLERAAVGGAGLTQLQCRTEKGRKNQTNKQKKTSTIFTQICCLLGEHTIMTSAFRSLLQN